MTKLLKLAPEPSAYFVIVQLKNNRNNILTA